MKEGIFGACEINGKTDITFESMDKLYFWNNGFCVILKRLQVSESI